MSNILKWIFGVIIGTVVTSLVFVLFVNPATKSKQSGEQQVFVSKEVAIKDGSYKVLKGTKDWKKWTIKGNNISSENKKSWHIVSSGKNKDDGMLVIQNKNNTTVFKVKNEDGQYLLYRYRNGNAEKIASVILK